MNRLARIFLVSIPLCLACGFVMDRRPPFGLSLGLSFNHADVADCSSYAHSTLAEVNTTVGTDLSMTGNGYVRYADDPAFDVSSEVTIAFWISTTSTRINYLISKWESPGGSDSYLIYMTSAGRVYFNTSSSGSYQSSRDLVGSESVRDGAWHHVACTYDGSASKIYIDGELDASKALSGTIHNSTTNLALGGLGLGTNSSLNFDGRMDDVRLYNRALPLSEIATLHQQGHP